MNTSNGLRMSYGVFVFDVIITFFLAAVLLWRYSDIFRQPIPVTLAVLTAWYFSFLIIFLIPLDVSSTIHANCTLQLTNTSIASLPEITTASQNISVSTIPQNLSLSLSSNTSSEAPDDTSSNITKREIVEDILQVDEDEDFLPTSKCGRDGSGLPPSMLYSLWRVVYWSSQLLTWIVLPLMQSFIQAGEFTFLGKLKSSLWDNMIYYTSYLFIAIILLVYIALQPGLHLDWQRTKAIAAAASNTWGLTLLVLMMGYGLVEVPRTLWNASKRGYSLNLAYFKVSKLWGEKSDAEGQLEEVLVSVEAVSRVVVGQELREKVDLIMNKVPLELMERVRRRGRVEEPEGGEQVEEKVLAKLHKQVVVALTAHRRTEAQWVELVERVYWLEDEDRNWSSNERRFKRQQEEQNSTGLASLLMNPTSEWYLRCLLKPLLYKVLACIALAMSVLLTWSEVTFFSERPTLSLFALVLQAGAYNQNYLAIELISFVTICYMCICSFYTLFKVRVLNYYYLASNHQSDPYTLLFSGALLCRLTPPLCLNFLSLVHMDSHVIPSFPMLETAYTRVMGHMDVVSIVQDYFNIYFPILLLLLTMATYFSLGSRLLSSLGFQQFLEVAGEQTAELVEEGKELTRRERRKGERLAEQSRRGREERSWDNKGEARQRTRDTTGLSSSSQANYSGCLEDLQDQNLTDQSQERHSQERNSRGRQPPRNLFDDI